MGTSEQPPTFEHLNLTGARFFVTDLSEARFLQSTMRGVVMRGVELVDVDIDGEVWNVKINGVDVGPLVEAELDRRDPDRVKMRPTEPNGFREAWSILQRRWAETVTRARSLDPALLHESVDGEWSFIQTLRHLVFATDAWIRRAIGGDPSPWDPLDLPFDEMEEVADVPWDRQARPSLDEVLSLRRDRMATVTELLERLTDERLNSDTTPVEGPGWPPSTSYPVRECLSIILNEEWQHRLYAERDLAVLER